MNFLHDHRQTPLVFGVLGLGLEVSPRFYQLKQLHIYIYLISFHHVPGKAFS